MTNSNREVRVIMVRFDELQEVKSYIYFSEDKVPSKNNLVVGFNKGEFYIGYTVGSYNIDILELIKKADQFGILECPSDEPIYTTCMTKTCANLVQKTA